jgi:hypothetical protein
MVASSSQSPLEYVGRDGWGSSRAQSNSSAHRSSFGSAFAGLPAKIEDLCDERDPSGRSRAVRRASKGRLAAGNSDGPAGYVARSGSASGATALAQVRLCPTCEPSTPLAARPQAPATSISPPPIRLTPIQPRSGTFSPRKSQAAAIRKTGARPSKA